MSKATTASLSNLEEQKQQELSSSLRALSGLHAQLPTAESGLSSAAAQFSHLQTSDSALRLELNVFASLTQLFTQYRESKGITVNPNIVLTQTISAEELASTDILREACKDNYKEGFDLALARITNIDFQDSSGKTILMHAIINGFYYGVEKLLQRGANVDLVDKQGVNALIYSAQMPHILYTKQIAERTKDINYKAPLFNSSNALHILLQDGNKTIFASELNGELRGTIKQNSILVLDENYVLASGWSGRTLGKSSICLVLTGEKIDLGGLTISGSEIAPVTNHIKALELVRFLVEQMHIDVNARDQYGQTPILLSTATKLFDVTELLLSYGAIDFPNEVGTTALKITMDASQQSLADTIATRQHIDPEIIKLWIAAKKGNADLVDQQIKKGVPLDSTIGNSRETTPLIEGVVSGNLLTVTTLVNAGASVNKIDKDQASPLYYSLGYGGQPIKPTIVKFLVSKGANVNQPMNDGDTPMHMAGYSACVGGMKLLLSHGAEINVVNMYGKTPLHVLLEKKALPTDLKLTAVKYLLCKSASPTLKDNDGHDAVYLAKNNFPEASSVFEHLDTLPTLGEFEASIVGLTQDFEL